MKLFLEFHEVSLLMSICKEHLQYRLHEALANSGACAFEVFHQDEVVWLKNMATKRHHFDLAVKIRDFERANFPAPADTSRSLPPENPLLTYDILARLGFQGHGKDILNRPAYRLKVPPENGIYYSWQIQIVIDPDLPTSNYNSGIVSLYRPGEKDAHCLIEEKDSEEKADFILWEHKEQGLRGGIKYINIPSECFAIAGHVTHLSRLNAIYTALTGNKPLGLRPELQGKNL